MYALHEACKRGDVQRTRELLVVGANPDEKDVYGRTPDFYAHRARLRGVLDAEECIYELERMNGEIKFAQRNGCTPLHWACHDGNVARIEELLDEELVAVDWRRLDIESPLRVACHTRKPESVRALLEAGVPYHTVGMSPLHAASRGGDVDCIRLLLEAGAPIDAFDYNFCTPLTDACEGGHFDAASFLIERGADVDAYEPGHSMALHAACTNGSLECVMLLLDAGVDTECHNYRGETPLILAIGRYQYPYRRHISLPIHGVTAFEMALQCGLQL
jgi:ankyrin repeat protein